jgi:hypothetical protein
VLALLGLLAVVTKTQPEPRYDPATVVDLPVVVTEVRAAAGENGLDGVRLIARTEADATIDVYLGPASFLKEFEITFAKGDRIQIIGSKVKFAGGSIVLAREVRKDSSTLYLRSKNGDPYWRRGD